MKLRKIMRYTAHGLFLLCLLALNNTLSAELISIPYSCGFEDPVENAKWVLNYGPEGVGCKDQWIIGTGAKSEGYSGLYISTDGSTPTYGCYKNTVVAYRTFSVPESIPYDISFDWMNNGAPGASELYVLLLMDLTDKPNMPLSDSTKAQVVNPSHIISQRMIHSSASFNSSTMWTNFSFQRSLPANQDFTLMFIWNNNCIDSIATPIGACIDNIQIGSTRCPKPYEFNVDHNCDTAFLSWKGVSTYYQVEYKLRSKTEWFSLGTQMGTQAVIPNLAEGSYDFRVRSICGSDTSAYYTRSGVLILCLERSCLGFNYLDLEKNAICRAGTFGTSPSRWPIRMINYGSGFRDSRHTVHDDQNERDERTGYLLRTVPEGEYASVRLGNWDNGAEAESIEYQYTVDSIDAILLMKYAVVLELPPHNDDKPTFELEIRDQYGALIDPNCGQANFEADLSLGWQINRSYGSDPVLWKNWTTVGLNLTAYAGQTLTIKLITQDCGAGGHFGYAYFTLGCTSAALTTNTCGDAPEMIISAPEGFSYQWYNPDISGWTDSDREIKIPSSDSTTYYCKVCFLENPNCCFELYTQVFPRFPIADFSYEIVTENCESKIRLINNSHVLELRDYEEVHTTEHCDMYVWEFSNGQGSSVTEPQIRCSNDGDTIFVRLTAYLADCTDKDSALIIVPPIGQTIDTISHEMCYGESYYFGSQMQMLFREGTFYDTVPSIRTGCDSITRLELTVHPQYDMPAVFDTICFGEIREFAGRQFSETKLHDVWEKSIYQCDSIVHLDLYVRDEITFDVEVTDVLDGPNSGKIEIKDVSISDYTYTINGELNGALTGLNGGLYTIILYNEYGCQSEEIEVIVFQDCLEADVQDIPVICADDGSFTLHYKIEKGYATTFDVIFSPEAQSAGFTNLYSQPADGEPVSIHFSSTVRPDIYEVDIRFEDLLCDSVHNLQSITVNYSSLILEQKWNDVIAIVNSRYNGGYDFSSYQWYKNGIPIDGANHSYLYVGNSELDYGAQYTVLLTRSDDGKTLFTCALEPAFKDADTQISLYPLIISKRQQVNLTVPEPAWVSVYDSMGRKHRTHQVPAGSNIGLDIPENEGYYIVIVQLENGIQESFKIAVR